MPSKIEAQAAADSLTLSAQRHCVMGEPYRGYRSPYCGDGTVAFIGPSGHEVCASSNLATGWLEEAWQSAKAQIDSRLDLLDRCKAILARGGRVEAVRLYRSETRSSLPAAMQALGLK